MKDMKSNFGLFLLVFLFSVSALMAQDRKRIWNIPKLDKKPYHFGFQVGLTNDGLNLKFNDKISETNILTAETVKSSGFNVGFIADLRLNKHFNLRFTPSLILVNRSIEYRTLETSNIPGLPPTSIETLTKLDEAALGHIPLTLKFRAMRRGNFRPYIFSGSHITIDMSSDEKVEEVEVLNLKPLDFGLHFGMGTDLYLEFFKLGIEAKYVYGLTNLKVDNGTPYYDVFDHVKTRGLHLILTFE